MLTERTKGLDVHGRNARSRRISTDERPYLGPAVVGAELCARRGQVESCCSATPRSASGSCKRASTLERRTYGQPHRERTRRFRPSGSERPPASSAPRRVVIAAGSGSKDVGGRTRGPHARREVEPLHITITEAAAPLIQSPRSARRTHDHAQATLERDKSSSAGGWPAHLVGERYAIPPPSWRA